MGFPDDRAKDGYDIQMQINFHGQYLLSKLILPSLKLKYDNEQEVRIVQHSSAARLRTRTIKEKYFKKAKQGELGGDNIMECMKRYQQTKLANITFALALAKKIIEFGLDEKKFKSTVAEPGLSITGLGENLFASHGSKSFFHRTKVNMLGYMYFAKMVREGKQSPNDGALCLLQAMYGEDVKNGDFFVPKGGRTGLPLKEISEGILVENSLQKEESSLDEENHKLIWDIAEEELGPYFENL